MKDSQRAAGDAKMTGLPYSDDSPHAPQVMETGRLSPFRTLPKAWRGGSGVPSANRKSYVTLTAMKCSASLFVALLFISGCAAQPPAFVGRIEPISTPLRTTWHAGCPAGPDQLRLLTLSYWNFEE